MKRLYLFLSITFLYGSLQAAVFDFNKFSGMNTTCESMMIGEDESPDMDNVDIAKDGNSLSRRKGQTELFHLGISTGVVKSFGYVKNSTYDKLLVGYASRVSAFDSAYIERVLISTATAGYVWDFSQNLDYTYMTNGKDTCQYTDGYSIFENSAMPKGSSIVFFNNTCFVSDVLGNRSRVYVSRYATPTDWTTGAEETDGEAFNVSGRGERVLDLEILGNSILVLCSNSIMKITGTRNPYKVTVVDGHIGCKSKGSVKTHLGYTYFLGSDGQYYRTDGSTVDSISYLKFRENIGDTAIANTTGNFVTITNETDFAL